MNYRNLLTALLLLPAVMSLRGQQISDSKTLMKSFRAGADAALEVTNKYGDIHVTHSVNDSITIRAEVTASSNTGEKLDALMSDVEINLSMTGETVRAVTSFTKGITPLFESLKGLTKNLINFDSRLKIDYFIEAPPHTELRLTNSYGDIYLGDETPELTLKLSNGNLDAAAVGKAKLVELIFCKANVRSIREGKLILSFSELRSRETENIKIASVSSKAWVDRCGHLDLDSKRDDLNIGTVEVLTGTSHFSDIIAEVVTGEINMSVRYGNLSFERIIPEFTLIDLRTSYADTDIALEEGSSYELELRHTNAFVSLPGFEPQPERTEISAEDKIFMTTASIGADPGHATIKIDATRGEVRIIQK